MFSLKKVKYKHILDIHDLNIKKYKVTCIVGESGSGKSTLLRLLNKLTSCDSGEIYYNDQSLNTINSVELRRNVVMLPQFPAIFPGTVRDNLLIGLKFAEKPTADDAKLRQILNIVHLNKNLDDDSDKLSGTSPVTAIKYQIAIMLGILGSVALTVILFVQLGYKTFFNDQSQLIMND